MFSNMRITIYHTVNIAMNHQIVMMRKMGGKIKVLKKLFRTEMTLWKVRSKQTTKNRLKVRSMKVRSTKTSSLDELGQEQEYCNWNQASEGRHTIQTLAYNYYPSATGRCRLGRKSVIT